MYVVVLFIPVVSNFTQDQGRPVILHSLKPVRERDEARRRKKQNLYSSVKSIRHQCVPED